MPQVCYVVLPFVRHSGSTLIPAEKRECVDADHAVREAHALAESHAGTVAFSKILDLDAGTATPALLITKVGDVPNIDYLS